jgi:hypothetical protein
MLQIIRPIARFGLSVGVILLNIGTLIWIFRASEVNRDDDKISTELIKSAIILVVISLIIYIGD